MMGKIGVTIPTYQRQDKLEEILATIPESVKVYLSDNGATLPKDFQKEKVNVRINKVTPVVPMFSNWTKAGMSAEEYVRLYTRKGLLEGVSLRPSNMFDLPLDLAHFNRWSLIPFGFCKSAVEQGSIELKTAGTQERNFVSVRDIVSIVEMIILGSLKDEIINVSGISTLSIREFSELVQSVMHEEFARSVELKLMTASADRGEKLVYKSQYIPTLERNIENHVKALCRGLLGGS